MGLSRRQGRSLFSEGTSSVLTTASCHTSKKSQNESRPEETQLSDPTSQSL